jgi:hypothetical protein
VATPPPGPGDQDPRPPDDPGLTLGHPAELASAVPVLLGFHPRDSLVLVSIGGDDARLLGLTLRIDLPSRSATPAELAALREAVVDSLVRDNPRGAAVLVFAPADGPVLPHRRLVDAVATELEERGVEVHSALWAESTAEGARWACYDPCGCGGVLPDPAGTEIAAESVLEGRVVHTSRTDLERLVAPPDPARVRRRERLLRAFPGSATDALDTADDGLDAAVRAIDEAIADAGAGRLLLDDTRVVALARALAAPVVRDEAMRRCLGRPARAAEQLWLALVRETPDPEAAEPAVLLAVSALQRGDGGLANIALDRAERAWPGHRLSRILRPLAAAGLPPKEVRDLFRDCFDGTGAVGAVRPAGGSARTARHRRPSS